MHTQITLAQAHYPSKIVDYLDFVKKKILENVDIILFMIGGSVIGAILLPLLVFMIFFVVGFTVDGVVSGSMAALWMSSIGNVPIGSPFAILQSLGTMGIFVGFNITVMLVGAVLGGFVGVFVPWKVAMDTSIHYVNVVWTFFIWLFWFVFIVLSGFIVGALIAQGIVVCVFKFFKLSKDSKFGMFLVIFMPFIGGILGSTLFYVIFS